MKKRFSRFSLRALVIAVLTIAVCWTLTATWGIETVLERIPPIYNQARNGNTLRVFFEGNAGSDSVERDFKARALFPFYITVEIKGYRISGSNSHEPELLSVNSTEYLWFFGYLKAL